VSAIAPATQKTSLLCIRKLGLRHGSLYNLDLVAAFASKESCNAREHTCCRSSRAGRHKQTKSYIFGAWNEQRPESSCETSGLPGNALIKCELRSSIFGEELTSKVVRIAIHTTIGIYPNPA
jgi:hypothetical protein